MLAVLLTIAAQATAEPPREAAEPLPPPPIVVIANEEERADERRVIVGSRVARRPVFEGGTVATSTGTRGLTPESGMTPYGGHIRVLHRKSCVADDPAIGAVAACRLIAAREAMAAGDHALVRGLLVPLAGDAARPAAERYAAAETLALSAEGEADPAFLEEAYLLMLESGAIVGTTRASLLRVVAGLALDRGDRAGARGLYAEAVELEPGDARALSNLAILQRETGDGDGVAAMRRAIGALEREGRDVPQGWRDFAASLPAPAP